MNIVSVAIGKKYHTEVERLQRSLPLPVNVFTEENLKYERIHDSDLINGLYHKTNLGNYFDFEKDTPVIFCDADMFTLVKDPFKTFKIKEETDFAYVPYVGKWHFPDKIRKECFDYHGHKINSGFMYFKDIDTAKKVSDVWSEAYKDRIKLYDVTRGLVNEYDEYALMIGLMEIDLNIELLDSKWNEWTLNEKEDILKSNSIFFQSHNYLNIV